MLRSEHDEFLDPYDEVKANIQAVIDENAIRVRGAGQAPTAALSVERIRTWKKIFEEFGLLYVDDADKRIRVTALGALVRDLHADLEEKVAGANDHLTRLGLAVLSRHVLRNPLESADYPADTDLHPYRAIWSICRALDDSIHWEEVNRVVMRLLHDADVPAAISHIEAVRAEHGTDYSNDDALKALGERAVEEGTQTRRRVTPWLTRAALGGTVMTSSNDGLWTLAPEYVPLIDEVLKETVTPPAEALTSVDGYMHYIVSGLELSAIKPTKADEAALDAAIRAVDRVGDRKIIALAGIPGTGKTRLARMLAASLTDNDPYRTMEIQFHESTGYAQFVEGLVPRADGTGYSLTPMTLRVINKRAKRDPAGRRYVLLIEEFTRANIHSVMGELLTYVEHRNRSFRLQYSQEEERIAPNLVIIATMNPRDRSALTLDDAIGRRIHRVDVPPSVDVLKEIAATNLESSDAAKLGDWYKQFVNVLPFGHGEFAHATSPDDLRDIWSGTLVHLLSDSSGNVRADYQEAAQSYPWP
jgi:5-methylcytosine-specific restriction protein B